jgi:hypothetical protein
MLFTSTLLLSLVGVVASADSSQPQQTELDRPDYKRLNANCPGYTAVAARSSAQGIYSTLQIAGEPCDVYGYDMTELTLDVTYETGKAPSDFYQRTIHQQGIYCSLC